MSHTAKSTPHSALSVPLLSGTATPRSAPTANRAHLCLAKPGLLQSWMYKRIPPRMNEVGTGTRGTDLRKRFCILQRRVAAERLFETRQQQHSRSNTAEAAQQQHSKVAALQHYNSSNPQSRLSYITPKKTAENTKTRKKMSSPLWPSPLLLLLMTCSLHFLFVTLFLTSGPSLAKSFATPGK